MAKTKNGVLSLLANERRGMFKIMAQIKYDVTQGEFSSAEEKVVTQALEAMEFILDITKK